MNDGKLWYTKKKKKKKKKNISRVMNDPLFLKWEIGLKSPLHDMKNIC